MLIPSNVLPFAAVTANLGPKTICHKHVDGLNLAYGWCVVCAMGEFDCKSGGHMVLHDAEIILEYGRGDILFLPSAIMAHENIAVQEHETRYSLTFYSAGGLFRYRALGFKRVKDLDEEELAEYNEAGLATWEAGCKLFSTLPELKELYRPKRPGTNLTEA